MGQGVEEGLRGLKTWKLQNGRGKEVNDVLKDFDELERTGLGPGNAIVARRYPVKYGGGEGGGTEGDSGTGEQEGERRRRH